MTCHTPQPTYSKLEHRPTAPGSHAARAAMTVDTAATSTIFDFDELEKAGLFVFWQLVGVRSFAVAWDGEAYAKIDVTVAGGQKLQLESRENIVERVVVTSYVASTSADGVALVKDIDS